MKWIGLTGGIASGKSTVAGLLESLGFQVVNADKLAHQALDRGTNVYDEVVKLFGNSILDSKKEVDRKKLGSIVFTDKNKLILLEKLIHPFVQEKARGERLRIEKQGAKFAFYDVPLLFEKNLEGQFDQIVVVACDENLQCERLKKRNGLNEAEINARLASQIPLSEKTKKTKFVIHNNSSIEELKNETEKVLKKLEIL